MLSQPWPDFPHQNTSDILQLFHRPAPACESQVNSRASSKAMLSKSTAESLNKYGQIGEELSLTKAQKDPTYERFNDHLWKWKWNLFLPFSINQFNPQVFLVIYKKYSVWTSRRVRLIIFTPPVSQCFCNKHFTTNKKI